MHNWLRRTLFDYVDLRLAIAERCFIKHFTEINITAVVLMQNKNKDRYISYK